MRELVIDKNILGLPDDLMSQLSNQYDKIRKVSEDEQLPQRMSDVDVASFCKKENCDFITRDTKAYIHFFDADARILHIERVWESRDDPHIYRIRIIE